MIFNTGLSNNNLQLALTYNEDTDYFGCIYNGEWKDVIFAGFKSLYLIKDRTQNSDYPLETYMHNKSTGVSNMTNSGLYLKTTYGQTTGVFAVDLTDYNKLKAIVKAENGTVSIGVFTDITLLFRLSQTTNTVNTELTVDVTDLSGVHYIGGNVYTDINGTLVSGYVVELWLE